MYTKMLKNTVYLRLKLFYDLVGLWKLYLKEERDIFFLEFDRKIKPHYRLPSVKTNMKDLILFIFTLTIARNTNRMVSLQNGTFS